MKIMCVVSDKKAKNVLGGNPTPHIALDPNFSHAMNKLWYITGDEGCGEVSLKLCV